MRAGIRALHDLAAGSKPWCLFVGPVGPHDPYVIPEYYATMYDPADVELPPSYYDNLLDKPRVYQRQRRFWGQMSEQEYREAIAHYWGFCTMQDDLLGMVLDALDATGQAENTVVIFTSDHGDYAGAHGLFMKGVAAFDECYHVPCVVRWPRGIANPGRTVGEFVTLADFAPTFAERPALLPDDGPEHGALFPRNARKWLTRCTASSTAWSCTIAAVRTHQSGSTSTTALTLTSVQPATIRTASATSPRPRFRPVVERCAPGCGALATCRTTSSATRT